MLIKRYLRKRKNPRRSRKSLYRFSRKRYLPRISLGIPKYRNAKLSYCDVLSSGVGAGTYTAWAYQTSLYDPYVAVGGHQPMFFDQYAAMYRRYVVYGIAYSLDIVTDQTTNGPLFVTMVPSGVGATPTTISLARERPGTKETTVSHGYKGRMKGYLSASKMLGVSRRKLITDDQYSALVSANPSQMAYLTLNVWNQTASSISCYVSIRLTFYCRFFDPQDPSQS